MKIYKDAHMKIFSSYIIQKNILEKELIRCITHFLVLVNNVLNILWHTKNNSVQNQEHKEHVIVNMLFFRKLYL